MSTLQVTRSTASQLEQLVNHHGDKSISIVMPTYESSSQVRQNSIRFKNLLGQAVEQLVADGESETEAERLVQPLREIERDDNFWQHQTAGLATYFAEGRVTAVGLHESPTESVHVSEYFYLTPVALDVASHRSCRVLALTWEEAKLYFADRNDLQPQENDSFPVALREVILPPDAEEQLQFRTQSDGAGGTMFHGQGQGEGMIESDRKRFLSDVGKRLSSSLDQPTTELILMATKEVQGEFVATTKITPQHVITASPDGLSLGDMTDRVVREINRKDFSVNNAELGEQLGTNMASDRATRDLQQVSEAATAGRIHTLLINPATLPQRNLSEDRTCELLNLAVIHTIQTGGKIAACSDAVLGSAPVAAIFRY